MVWSWSHTAEAYADLECSIAGMPREWLETVYAEWKANDNGGIFKPHNPDTDAFDERRYFRAKGAARYIPTGVLAERIYAWAEKQSNCDNGGFEAWCCPHGCGPHTIEWDAWKKQDEHNPGCIHEDLHAEAYAHG